MNWLWIVAAVHEESLYSRCSRRDRRSVRCFRIDKATENCLGSTATRRSRIADAYTTPALLRYGSTTEIVITGGDAATGHDPATGKELWRADGLNPSNDPIHRIVASPVVFGDMIYAPTRERPMLALKAGGRGDVTKSHLVWSFDSGPDVPTPVTDGTYVYIVRDNGACSSRRKDRQTNLWSAAPRSATYSGSPVLGDGKIYVTNEDGVTVVVKAGPVFELLAENDLGEYTLSSPAISDGQIFIRTEKALYAVGKRIQSH